MQYNSLEEFCNGKDMQNPLNWIKYFDQNLSYVDNAMFNNRQVIWPDMLLKYEEGNCVDFALFTYFVVDYFKQRMIHMDSAIAFINTLPERYDPAVPDAKQYMYGHAVPLVLVNENTYVINYDGKNNSYIYGPFSSYDYAFNLLCGYLSLKDTKFKNIKEMKYTISRITDARLVLSNELENIKSVYNTQISQINILNILPTLIPMMKELNCQKYKIEYEKMNNNVNMLRYFHTNKINLGKVLKSDIRKSRMFKIK